MIEIKICGFRVRRCILLAFLSVVFLFSSQVWAQSTPDSIPYRGVLEFNGEPVSQNVWMEFRIYDAQEGGNQRYYQRSNVIVNNGKFTQVIGPTGSDGNQFRQVLGEYSQLYLEVVVLGDIGTDTDDLVLLNRQRLITAPYSILAAQAANGNPVGIVQAFAGNSIPHGWLLCDGRTYNSADYPELAGILGVASGNFSVPDLQGYFIRGLDTAGIRDANASRQLRSVQSDTFMAHSHDVAVYTDSADNVSITAPYVLIPSPCCNSIFVANDPLNVSSHGGNETRPKNIALNYIIKY